MLNTLHSVPLHWVEFFQNKPGGETDLLSSFHLNYFCLSYKRRKEDSVDRGLYHHHI